MRHQPLEEAQTGWLCRILRIRNNHPVRSAKDASQHFPGVASTPPWQGGDVVVPNGFLEPSMLLPSQRRERDREHADRAQHPLLCKDGIFT